MGWKDIRDFLLTPIPLFGTIKSGKEMKQFAEGVDTYMKAIRGGDCQNKEVHLHQHNNYINLTKTYIQKDGTKVEEKVLISKDDPFFLEFLEE